MCCKMCKCPATGEISIAAGCHKVHRSNTVTQAEPFKRIHLEAASVLPLINGAAGRTGTGQRDSSHQMRTITSLLRKLKCTFLNFHWDVTGVCRDVCSNSKSNNPSVLNIHSKY